jgi:hypothetical protein
MVTSGSGARPLALTAHGAGRLHGWMAKARDTVDQAAELELLGLLRAIAAGDRAEVDRRLESAPGLAVAVVQSGATRQDPDTYFLAAIRHHVYRGDTALHIAAAANEREVAELLFVNGADPRARNRRGAEPLHYAADGGADGERRDPRGRRDIVEYLIAIGADPNSLDDSGVAALHRAVRNRCMSAVSALVENGADERLPNSRGSTPLHLAVQNTGKSSSGTAAARDQQRQIIAILLERGAMPTDTDANG